MSPKYPGMTNAEASASSRSALIKAGAAIFLEETTKNPFASLKTRAICERAGYSTGAFYVHWPEIDSYYLELGRFLLAADGGTDLVTSDFLALADEANMAASRGVVDGVLGFADRDFDLLLSNALWEAMPLITATWGRTRLRDDAAHGYRKIDDLTADVYLGVLRRHKCNNF